MSEVIRVERLTRRYGAKLALNDVSLSLQKGKVLGLVGENGAGKTTLIKHILGLLTAQQGQVRVFGLDPVENPVSVLGNIGYLAEEDGLPSWMRVHELQRYFQGFYPNWDQTYAEGLREQFRIDRRAKIGQLSKGQRARVGLMAALAYRPDLLLLDEPSSGLDPIVRREILTSIVRAVASENRTVLFSSHLLSEIEMVADEVAMIRDGEILFCDELDAVKRSHQRVTLCFEQQRISPPELQDTFCWEGYGREWTCLFGGNALTLDAAAALAGATIVQQDWLTLDEIFIARSATEVSHQ
jgi:ABC-2 type transport system ATP-binding protein